MRRWITGAAAFGLLFGAGAASAKNPSAPPDKERTASCAGDFGTAGELWFVNTRFSCLCTLDPEYSFVPRWRPPCVTALAAEDRCHLNGLALAADEAGALRPRYDTALGATDTPGGWRPDKVRGGCLLEVPGGAVVASVNR